MSKVDMWSAHLIWANIIMARGTDDGMWMCSVMSDLIVLQV